MYMTPLIIALLITIILSLLTEYYTFTFVINLYHRIKSNHANKNDHKG